MTLFSLHSATASCSHKEHVLSIYLCFAMVSGYENSTGNWDDYSRYVSASGMQVVSPVSTCPFTFNLPFALMELIRCFLFMFDLT